MEGKGRKVNPPTTSQPIPQSTSQPNLSYLYPTFILPEDVCAHLLQAVLQLPALSPQLLQLGCQRGVGGVLLTQQRRDLLLNARQLVLSNPSDQYHNVLKRRMKLMQPEQTG
jgi:hypothetical protein